MSTTLNITDMPVYRRKLYSQFDKLVSVIFIVFLTQSVTSVQNIKDPSSKTQYVQHRCS